MEMTDDERAEMLSGVAHTWCERIAEVLDDYSKLTTTYPELKDAMSVVVQVNVTGHPIIQAMCGREGNIKQVIISLNQLYLGGAKHE